MGPDEVTGDERLIAIDAAAEEYASHCLEIDPDARVIKNDDGCYWVQAWVYVEPKASQ